MVTGKPERRLAGSFSRSQIPSFGQVLPEQKVRHSGATIDFQNRNSVENLMKSIGLLTRLVECPARGKLRRVNSMVKPNGRLVLVSYTHYCASTSSLSTRWSSWALQGNLILERASRLYAFSGYHNRTSLPSRAIGMTTGTQEVRPSRSSRTKDSPPQISYAHSR